VIYLTIFFRAASRRHNDVIIIVVFKLGSGFNIGNCGGLPVSGGLECLVTTSCSNRTVHRHAPLCTVAPQKLWVLRTP